MKGTLQIHLSDIVNAGIFGLAVGDAIGVPVEFQSRQELKSAPVMGLRGGGTHGQPEELVG